MNDEHVSAYWGEDTPGYEFTVEAQKKRDAGISVRVWTPEERAEWEKEYIKKMAKYTGWDGSRSE